MQTTSRVAFLLASTALVATALAPSDSRAQSAQDQATIQVSASVETSCALATDPIPIDFGIYDDTDHTVPASFDITCNPGTELSLSITGDTPDGFGDRFLPNDSDPAQTLKYVIYEPSSTFPWLNSYTHNSTGGTETLTFDATIYAGQLSTAAAGTYSQSLTLNMTVVN